MKRVMNLAGIFITLVVTLVYLLSCLAPYISPERFSAVTILGLAWLPMLVVFVMVIISWLFVRKKIALLLLLILFAGYKSLFSTVGFNVARPTWTWAKDSASIRIMCWNVNYMGNPFIAHDHPDSTRRRMLAFISEVKPDILCLQDFSSVEEGTTKNVFFRNLDDVKAAGGFASVHYAFFYQYKGTNYSDKMGVAIFSRYPIIDSASFRTNNVNDQTFGYADILFDGKPLRLFVAHLSSMQLWPNQSGHAGIDHLKGDSTRQKTFAIVSKLSQYGRLHAQEAETIKSAMNTSPHPVVLGADLNAVPSGYVYHTLKKGLNDAFLEKDFGIGGTYNMVFPKLRIDVLLHAKQIEVLQYTRPVVKLSDHYPIIADIRWKK